MKQNPLRRLLRLPMDAKSQLTALLALKLLKGNVGPWIRWAHMNQGGSRMAAAKEAQEQGENVGKVLRLTGLFDRYVIALIEGSPTRDSVDGAIEYLTRTKFAVSAPELHNKPVYLTPAALVEDVLFHAIEVEEVDRRVMYDRILADKAKRQEVGGSKGTRT